MSKEEKIIDNTILDSKVLSDSDLDQVSGGQMNTPDGNPMGGGKFALAGQGNICINKSLLKNVSTVAFQKKDN